MNQRDNQNALQIALSIESKVTNSNQASYVRFSCARSIFVLRWLLAKTSLSLIGEPVETSLQALQMKIPVEQQSCNLKKNICVQHISTPYPLWHPVRQFAGKLDKGKVLEFSKVITALLLYILPFAIDQLTRPLCDTKTNLYP